MSNGTEGSLDAWYDMVETVFSDDTYSSKLLFSASLLVVFLASCAANIVTCIVIYSNKTMHTATNYYLFDLAVSDLLVTLLILISAHQVLTLEHNILDYKSGVLTSKVFFCIQYLLISLLWNHGILVLTAIAIERYIAICYPMMIQSTPVWKRVFKIILVLWITAIIETLPSIWTLNVERAEEGLLCVMHSTPTAQIITASSVMITFVMPLNIMIFVYATIAVKINDHQKYHLNFVMINNTIQKRNNVITLICALTVSFVVCWLPTYIVRMAMVFMDIRIIIQFPEWFSTLNKIAIFNSWFTTVMNPVLFSLISVKFRKALKMLWDKKIRKRYVKKATPEVLEMKLETVVTN